MNKPTFISVVLLWFSTFALAAQGDPYDYWKRLPRGVNMASKNPVADFEALRGYGGTLVRFGATGRPADFTFLVKGSGDNEAFDLSPANLAKVKDLAKSMEEKNLRLIISLADIPGRRWEFRKRDCRIWDNKKFQDGFVMAWEAIANALKGSENIAGYDLINEPYLPAALVCKGYRGTIDDLISLYKRTVEAIRKIDVRTPIILESPEMASAHTITQLPVYPASSRVIYSFHYYEPFSYFSARENGGKLTYPGLIPSSSGKQIFWDIGRHRQQLAPVIQWQRENSIESYRIFVGEFGVWRKAQGAQSYLQDLTKLFNEQGWPWAYYSFREDEWDNTDLEKEGKIPGRRPTDLFRTIQTQFR